MRMPLYRDAIVSSSMLICGQVLLDNAAINRIAAEKLHIANPNFSQANQLVLVPAIANSVTDS